MEELSEIVGVQVDPKSSKVVLPKIIEFAFTPREETSAAIDISTAGVPFVNNVVGARRGAAFWQPDSQGYVWVFGGEGYDSSGATAPGYLNDMWTYLPFP